ncbi:MAG: DUF2892 domain-containing protein [Candidatus Hydrothermarchaeales archaeon]
MVRKAILREENVGGLDRIMRVWGGMAIFAVSFFELQGTAQVIIGTFGIYGLVTGTLRFCLVNKALKINTAKKA